MARRARRGSLARSGAGRARAPACTLYAAAGRRSGWRQARPHPRPHRVRRGAAVFDRLPALAFRRGGGATRRPVGGHHAPGAGRQSACDLSAARRKHYICREIGNERGEGAVNAPVLEKTLQQRLAIVDCDIHPTHKSPAALRPYLSERWQEHAKTFGAHVRQGLNGQLTHPRMQAAGQRADAYPADGGPPGSDLPLMRTQHLDRNGVEIGMLVALARGGMEEQNQDFAAALSHAVNEWQLAEWVSPEPRLRAGIVVPQEDPATAVAEIEARAPDAAFRQIIISPRTSEPLGRRRYWPIFAAAEAAGLPIGLHPAGNSGGYPSTGSGWPTYYMQEHYSFETGMQSVMASLIFEGVFERFPKLRVCL